MSQDTDVKDVAVSITNNSGSERRVRVLSIIDGTVRRKTVHLSGGAMKSLLAGAWNPSLDGEAKVYVELSGGMTDVTVTALVRRDKPVGTDGDVEILWDREPQTRACEKWYLDLHGTDVGVGVEDAPDPRP